MPLNETLLRDRPPPEHRHGEVRFVELFFDLVFVFAVTQLSHLLLARLTFAGTLGTSVLMLAVWWVWIYTSWVTNWLDPDKTPVRILLFSLMVAGLVLSASIPRAFDDRALWFAGAYVAMQVGRSLFVLYALQDATPELRLNFLRITVWLIGSGCLWIAGALVDPDTRLLIWAVAMALEFVSPAIGFWVPGLGRSSSADWDVSGDHLAERCGLFIIIALGESILVTGATFAELDWNAATLTSAMVAVVGTIAMWWIYFNIGAERGRRVIAHAENPGRLARAGYTYMHVILVAGIIGVAVSDEIILKHPDAAVDRATATVLITGPALFLLGNLLFKWATAGRPPQSHLAGLAALGLLPFVAFSVSPLGLASLATGVLVAVAGWETWSLGTIQDDPGTVE